MPNANNNTTNTTTTTSTNKFICFRTSWDTVSLKMGCNLRYSASGSHLHRQKLEATSVSVTLCTRVGSRTRVDLPCKKFRSMRFFKGICLLSKRSQPRLHYNNVHCNIWIMQGGFCQRTCWKESAVPPPRSFISCMTNAICPLHWRGHLACILNIN